MTGKRRGKPTYNNSVFINCPFDDDYRSLFRALVFAIEACGFGARCALEARAVVGDWQTHYTVGCSLPVEKHLSALPLNHPTLPPPPRSARGYSTGANSTNELHNHSGSPYLVEASYAYGATYGRFVCFGA